MYASIHATHKMYVYIYIHIIHIEIHNYTNTNTNANSYSERNSDMSILHQQIGQTLVCRLNSLPFQHLEINLVGYVFLAIPSKILIPEYLKLFKKWWRSWTSLEQIILDFFEFRIHILWFKFVQGTVSSSDICNLILAISVLRLKKSVSIAPKAPRPPSYPSWPPRTGSPWVAVDTSVLPCDGEDLLVTSSAMATLETRQVVSDPS